VSAGLVAVLVMGILAVVVVVGIVAARRGGFRAVLRGPWGMGATVEGDRPPEAAGSGGDAAVKDSKAGGSIAARGPGSATVSGSEAVDDITADATEEGDYPKAP
jgi:hypothetical protein